MWPEYFKVICRSEHAVLYGMIMIILYQVYCVLTTTRIETRKIYSLYNYILGSLLLMVYHEQL